MDLTSSIDLEAFRADAIVTCTIEGLIEPEDLRELMGTTSEAGAEADIIPAQAEVAEDPSNLSRLRERHHSVARLVAKGMAQSLVASICGYQEQYLSILLNNPAMQELVQMYRVQLGSAAEVIVEKLRTVGGKSLEEIDERLSDPQARKQLSTQDLIAIGKLGFDRAGHGPQSTHKIEEQQHIYDHAKLQELSRNARTRNQPRLISPEAVRQSLQDSRDKAQSVEDASFEPEDPTDAGS